MILLPASISFLLAAFQSGPSLVPAVPDGWRHERLEFPLSFAPDLAYRGFEDLAFAPGMFEPESDSYFSYALALRLEGDVEVDEGMLTRFLESYYRGLCRAVAEERKVALDASAVHAQVAREGEGFRASVAMFDAFVTGEPLELALELSSHSAPRATEILGLASPLASDEAIWNELHVIGAAWREARPAPVFLNHVFLVLDRASYAAIESSSFLRETFAVSEVRRTVRADLSYSGLYFYGARTYFEFLPPDAAASLVEGSSGLGLGTEVDEGLASLSRRLEERKIPSQRAPITRELDGKQVPWFEILGVEMPSSRLTLFALAYDPRFLASWHADLAPAHPGIRRADVLERYAAALDRSSLRSSAPLADVAAVEVAVDAAERERLLGVCEAAGYEIETAPETWTCHGPQFRLVLSAAEKSGGVTGIELALRAPIEREPLELGKIVLRFDGRTAAFVLRP
jgi:hypothetical protein